MCGILKATFCKAQKNRPLSRKLLRGDTDSVVVVRGGEWGAKRPIPLPSNQPVDGVISTKKRSEASFAGRNLFLCHSERNPEISG